MGMVEDLIRFAQDHPECVRVGPPPEYEVGDTIEQSMGHGNVRKVLVTEKCRNIKNGSPGFSGDRVGQLPEGLSRGVWGYDSSVVRVIKKGTK